MGLIGRFLSGYSENFLLALTCWPVASAGLTLPILAYLYHRDGRLRFSSALTVYLAVLYLLGLACFTLWPLPSGTHGPGITYGIPWQLDPLAFVADFRREGVSTIPQIVFNVVLFMPLGALAGRLLRWGIWQSAAAGLAVSLAIEAAQGTGLFGIYPYAYRTADVCDLMYNTAGAVLGWYAARLAALVLPEDALAEEGAVTRHPGFIRRCVALWLDLLLVTVLTIAGAGAVSLVLAALPQGDGLLRGPWALAVAAAAFVFVEGAVPWRSDGSTPGGRFVRMSFETRERSGVRRAVFYLARLATLAAALLAPGIAVPVLALFYLIARKMPYDLI